MFGTTTSLCQGTNSSLRATNASPASMLSWFKLGNAVSADDDDAVPIDAGAVPNDDSVPLSGMATSFGITGARRGGMRASPRTCRVR